MKHVDNLDNIDNDLKYSKLVLTGQLAINVIVRKLFIVDGSIPSWRVLMLLYEFGLPFEAHRLAVMTVPKQTRSVAFLKLNPRKNTTLVEPDGSIITESLGLIQYLDHKYNDGVLSSKSDVNYGIIFSKNTRSRTFTGYYEEIETIFEIDDDNSAFS